MFSAILMKEVLLCLFMLIVVTIVVFVLTADRVLMISL